MLWHSSSESVPNTYERSLRAVLSCFLIILRKIDLENVCPSVTWNLMGFCLHIGLRWQISCGRFWEYATSKWNAIIWKRKNFFSIFCCIYLIYIKFWTLWRKRWSSWVIYFRNYRMWKSLLKNSLKAPFQNRLWKSTCESVPNACKISMRPFWSCFPSLSRKLIWRMSPLVLGEILGVFLNTLTSDGKYHVQGCKNLQLKISMQLSEKQKHFLKFLFHFWNLYQILNILKKRWFS